MGTIIKFTEGDESEPAQVCKTKATQSVLYLVSKKWWLCYTIVPMRYQVRIGSEITDPSLALSTWILL